MIDAISPTSIAASSFASPCSTSMPIDTDLNWRVRRGYGALISAYGASCRVALNCAVTLIDHSAKRIRIETAQGTLTADKVIVTVPTNLIADEAIRFHPPLPAKVDAARGLPLGLADKVTLALEEPEALPKEGNLRAATMRTAMGTYHLRPFGQPCIEGFFGGRFAQALEDTGPGAFAAESINEIAAILGNDFRRKLKPLAESATGPCIRSRAVRTRTRYRVTPAIGRFWPRRSMDGCSLRRSNIAGIFLDRAWGEGFGGEGGRAGDGSEQNLDLLGAGRLRLVGPFFGHGRR